MTWHIHGAIITPFGTAANNRGENEGNITTLQKLLWRGSVHTTVSAEAIRWAIRYSWQMLSRERPELKTNRQWDDERDDNTWRDQKWTAWDGDGAEGTYIDDDVLGFMLAEGAKSDGSDKAAPKGKKAKGTIDKRRGALEVTRAVSSTPFAGDITFNAKSGVKGSTSLYGTEVHATRFQYGFSLTPQRLRLRNRALDTLDAIVALGEVAGNHSRFHYDFSPDSIVLRLTHDPAPRLLYCFDDETEPVQMTELARKVDAGDIDAKELWLGGAISSSEQGKELGKRGARVDAGVLAVSKQLKNELGRVLAL
jgi:CRISPR-associated protein Cst2